jgi:D-alanyl-D-alanine carboxypeptidase (penicillin-binding protein 5/6)
MGFLGLVIPFISMEVSAKPREAVRGQSAATATTRVSNQAPAHTPIGPFDTAAKQAILVDFDTGYVLLEKSADDRVPPSSMSKLMTMYVVFDMLKQDRLRLDQELPVSERAWRMGGSKMFVQIGTQVKVSDLIRGVVVQSGNDACIVLAEGISGSEQQFADLLNEYSGRIGLKDSNFRNATGWPDPEHRMSVRDLSILARRLIADFPENYQVYNERSFSYNGINQDNRNPTLARVPGADGLKTGHTEDAGYGLTASVKRGDRRLIMVFNGLASMRARAEESERILEWGFREFENVKVATAGSRVGDIEVRLGEKVRVALVAEEDLVVTVPKKWRSSIQTRLVTNGPLEADVLLGARAGAVHVTGQGFSERSAPAVAGEAVRRLGIIYRILHLIGVLSWFR